MRVVTSLFVAGLAGCAFDPAGSEMPPGIEAADAGAGELGELPPDAEAPLPDAEPPEPDARNPGNGGGNGGGNEEEEGGD